MTELHKRPNRHPKYKTAYRVKNWAEYDKALRDYRDITLWISQDAIDSWTPPQIGKRGAQPVYSDLATETALSLRLLFDLPSRQTEGFLHSLLTLMNLALPCPNHTTLSRRNASEHLLAIESEGRFAWKRTSGSTRRVTPRTPLRGSNGRSATACGRSTGGVPGVGSLAGL
jgi:hypothetical protein